MIAEFNALCVTVVIQATFQLWDKRLKDGRMSTNNAQRAVLLKLRSDKYKCVCIYNKSKILRQYHYSKDQTKNYKGKTQIWQMDWAERKGLSTIPTISFFCTVKKTSVERSLEELQLMLFCCVLQANFSWLGRTQRITFLMDEFV